jgi:4-amino-4-deoxy-L-arabinose transferase-like glycosyltransferase
MPRPRLLALAGIIALVVVGSVLRLASIGTNLRVSADEQGNVANANAILDHKAYRTFRWAPGTPFMFAVAARLRGFKVVSVEPHAHTPAQYAQLALEIATLLLMAAVAWRLAGPWAALLAVALAALYVPLILITRTYLSEPLGGLMAVAMFAGAAWARHRGPAMIACAGVIAGLACLAREDLFPGVLVIAIAIGWGLWRSSRRAALMSGLLYLLCAIAVITPWVIYASNHDGRLVPITDGGTDAFFIGTYLPGGGEQYPDIEHFQHQICQRFPADCHALVSRGTGDMFKIVASRYPGLSENAAINEAGLENLRHYALGQPLAFVGMLAAKLWTMWGSPWSGGNGYGTHPKADTSRVQHLIFVALAFIGLLGGALLTRKWELVTVSVGLAVITFLNLLTNAEGRDNLRFMPLLFTFGACGLWLLARQAWPSARSRTRSGRAVTDGDVGSLGLSGEQSRPV